MIISHAHTLTCAMVLGRVLEHHTRVLQPNVSKLQHATGWEDAVLHTNRQEPHALIQIAIRALQIHATDLVDAQYTLH